MGDKDWLGLRSRNIHSNVQSSRDEQGSSRSSKQGKAEQAIAKTTEEMEETVETEETEETEETGEFEETEETKEDLGEDWLELRSRNVLQSSDLSLGEQVSSRGSSKRGKTQETVAAVVEKTLASAQVGETEEIKETEETEEAEETNELEESIEIVETKEVKETENTETDETEKMEEMEETDETEETEESEETEEAKEDLGADWLELRSRNVLQSSDISLGEQVSSRRSSKRGKTQETVAESFDKTQASEQVG